MTRTARRTKLRSLRSRSRPTGELLRCIRGEATRRGDADSDSRLRARYDMLCFEGIALMLNIFAGKASIPNYRVVAPSNGEIHQITVHQSVFFKRRKKRLRR